MFELKRHDQAAVVATNDPNLASFHGTEFAKRMVSFAMQIVVKLLKFLKHTSDRAKTSKRARPRTSRGFLRLGKLKASTIKFKHATFTKMKEIKLFRR